MQILMGSFYVWPHYSRNRLADYHNMKPFLSALLSLLVLGSVGGSLLGGCGASSKRTAANPAVVVFLGDSITINWSAPWAGTTFTSHPTWINEGVTGQNSNQLPARFEADVVKLHPEMVAILTGTNDVYPGWLGPCITSEVPAVFQNKINTCENIQTMVEQARAAGIVATLYTLFDQPAGIRATEALTQYASQRPDWKDIRKMWA
jgi:hypothetical protein